MAVALDTTAHPANAGNLTASHVGGTTWQTLTPSAFSTGSGPVIIRAYVYADGSAAPFGGTAGVAWVGGTPSGWSAFTKWVDFTDSAHEFGWQVWTAFSASTAATTQQVRFTANANNVNQAGWMGLLVENGCAATESAARGATAGYIDQLGSNQLISQAITPSSTGSSLAGGFGNANSNTALTANSNTSVFDAHFEASPSDASGFGRFKVSGAYTGSTAGTAETLGCTGGTAPNTDQFTSAVVTEIQPPASGTPITAVGSGKCSSAATVAVALAVVAASLGACSGTASLGGVVIVAVGSGKTTSAATITETLAVTAAGSGATSGAAELGRATVFPLAVSSDSRSFVDANGNPFRIHGDAMWDAIINLNLADLRTYLNDRADRGFNALFTYTMNSVPYFFGSNAPWALQLGGSAAGAAALPFLKNISGGTWNGDPTFSNFDADFSQPNDAYFAWIAQIVDEAAARGMVMFLAPMYLGFGGGVNDGWWQTLSNASNTSTVCSAFGAYLANGHGAFTGFKNRPNIIWISGGDMLPTNGSTGALRSKAVITGMQGAGDTHLVSQHWQHDDLSRDQTDIASLLTAQSAYTHGNYPSLGPTYPESRAEYSATPALPTFLIETTYWSEHGGTQGQQRYFQWASALSCVGGTTFGFGPFWGFTTSADGTTDTTITATTSWQASHSYANNLNVYVTSSGNWYRLTSSPGTSGTTKPSGTTTFNDNGITWTYVCSALRGVLGLLGEPGVVDMQRLGAFLDPLSWQKLVPSGLTNGAFTQKTLITAGGGTAATWNDGTFSSGGMDWVVASSTLDGTLLVAYIPPAHSGTITVDMTAMAGPTRARWYDPTTGLFTLDSGGIANASTHVFTTPGTNAGGDTDWALLLDTLPLSAAGKGANAGSAILTETLAVTAAGSGKNSGTATVFATAFSAAGSGSSSGTATIVQAIAATAAGTGAQGSTSTIAEAVAVTAAGVGAGSGASTLTETLALVAASKGSGSGGSTLAETVALTSTGAGATSGAATIGEQLAVTASGSGAGSGTASISAGTLPPASGSAASSGTATLSVAQAIGAGGTGTSAGAATVTVSNPSALTAAGAGSNSGRALVSLALAVTGSGSGATAGGASISTGATGPAPTHIIVPPLPTGIKVRKRIG